ncbi:hypothetical protein IT414_02850 [bacterium]|nr:hypothetical protein [bacterium]
MPRRISVSLERGDTKVSIATEDNQPFGRAMASYLTNSSPDTRGLIERAIELDEGRALNVWFYQPITDQQELAPLVRAIKAALHDRNLTFTFEEVGELEDRPRHPMVFTDPDIRRAGEILATSA